MKKYRVVEGSGNDDYVVVFESDSFAACDKYCSGQYEDEEEEISLGVSIEKLDREGHWTTDF